MGDEVRDGTTHCTYSLSWTYLIYTCGPGIIINRHRPHSLRALNLSDRVFCHIFREAKRSGANQKDLAGQVCGSHGGM